MHSRVPANVGNQRRAALERGSAGAIAWSVFSHQKLGVNNGLIAQVGKLRELLVCSIRPERLLVGKRHYVNLLHDLGQSVRRHNDRSLDPSIVCLHYPGRACLEHAEFVDRILAHRENHNECHRDRRLVAAG